MIGIVSALVVIHSIMACNAASPPIITPYRPAPAPYHPAPYHPAPPAPYHPAPKPVYHPAPKPAYHPAPPAAYHPEAYGPPFSCPNYPYCEEAPYNLYHLQHEIEALRHRAALIVKHGELLQRQQPNKPFVQEL